MPNNLLPFDGEAYLIKNYFSQEKSTQYYQEILSEVKMRRDKIQMFGKWHDQAREVAWHGEAGITYKYSNIKMISPGWTPTLELINAKLEKDFNFNLNSVLVNHYRNGDDYMSYHSDNEKELGVNPVILSLSMGAKRDFYFKHKKSDIVKLELENGDLLIMKGSCQDYWKHSIPKRKRVNSSRLNLTFRKILNSF